MNARSVERGTSQRTVAVVTESFLPTLNGVTTSVLAVLDHLERRGHRAVVIAPDTPGLTQFRSRTEIERHRSFDVHRVPAVAYRQFPVALPHPVLDTILAASGADVLHAASPFLLGGRAITAAGRLGIPSVAVFQTDVAGFARRNGLTATVPLVRKILGRIHAGASLTLAPSSATAAMLEAEGVPRVARWGRGVDTALFHPARRRSAHVRAMRRRIAPHGETIVGYVGRLAPEKEVERLADLGGVPGIRIVVAGGGPSRQFLERRLRHLDVTFTGPLRGEALADAYAALDVFVHTGPAETFGQTLQEAHAAGLPVVAPGSGGPLDLVAPGLDGELYDPDDVDGLRAAVLGLHLDRSRAERMGSAGRLRVEGTTWEAVGDELLVHHQTARHIGVPPTVSRGVRAGWNEKVSGRS
ncbi:glycosyltransferase family 4 protein [Curtobacterium sp. SL109]|uniref:glycosyltransferase family 4 protein n=1 Tax=Curtobacterium sp. SL109 TaxID=2994662 RepID=UPI00227358AD|nr:glycosyltransferase family 1 protein [Curtobacterium sp. SL109]MCY1695907.1 glycosyltransferase family 1 protein [Curtobacterium sp. SL109]